jgi:YVTN family beta-propeller protein
MRPLRSLAAPLLIAALSLGVASAASAAPPDVAAHRAVRTGSLPKGVTLSPDGTRLYVTNYGALDHHNISMFDPITLAEVGHIDVPGIVVETAISPDGATLYASNFKRNAVEFIDIASRRVTREVRAGAHPKILVLSRDGRRLFAANWSSQNVTEIDTETGHVVRTLQAQENPRGMAATRHGRLYIANFNSGSIDIYEGPDMATHRRLSRVCKIPRHLVLAPDDSKLYVSCMADNAVAVIDTRTDAVIRRIPVGHFPKALDVTQGGRYVVTADYRGSTTTIIDTKDWTARTIDVPGMDAASGVVAARHSLRFWVTGWYDNHLYEIGPAEMGAPYAVDAETTRLTLMRRTWHRKHPVE